MELLDTDSMMLFILTSYNTDERMLSSGTPLGQWFPKGSNLRSLPRLIWKWRSERKFWIKVGSLLRNSRSNRSVKNSVFPRDIKSFIKVNKYCQNFHFYWKSFTDEMGRTDLVISCTGVITEIKDPNQSDIDHSFHRLAKTTREIYRPVIGSVLKVPVRF